MSAARKFIRAYDRTQRLERELRAARAEMVAAKGPAMQECGCWSLREERLYLVLTEMRKSA